MQREEALERIGALGFEPRDAMRLWEHFDDAEQRGKLGHGHSRIPWLEGLEGFDPAAKPVVEDYDDTFWRVYGDDAIGYLVLRTVVDRCIARPPDTARVVVCNRTFPTGMLGHYVRKIARAGLVGVLTATSPPRLGPEDGPKVAGTNPLAIGIPSGDGKPVVVDVSMGAVTWGDVIAGRADEEQLVPFGGKWSHKSLALAIGLQLLVDTMVVEPGFGALMIVALPASDPVAAMRATGIRLPGAE